MGTVKFTKLGELRRVQVYVKTHKGKRRVADFMSDKSDQAGRTAELERILSGLRDKQKAVNVVEEAST